MPQQLVQFLLENSFSVFITAVTAGILLGYAARKGVPVAEDIPEIALGLLIIGGAAIHYIAVQGVDGLVFKTAEYMFFGILVLSLLTSKWVPVGPDLW